jgi:hypothetical protein
MTKDEALRLALEALEGVLDDSPKVLDASISGGLYEVVQCRDAITAIKAALEANEFNPDWDTQAVLVEEIQRMAKRIEELEAKDEPYALEASMFSNDRVKIDPVTGNVSIGTPQQEAKDEPVAYINVEQRKLEWAKYVSWGTPTVVNLPKIPLYTTPPQRTWVGLTDEEILVKCESVPDYDIGNHDLIHFARAIEAKLKAKNT